MNENFGVGAVMGTSFRVFARNLIPFLLIASVLNAPIIVWTMSVRLRTVPRLAPTMP